MGSAQERFAEYQKLKEQGRELLEAAALERARQMLDQARVTLDDLVRQEQTEVSGYLERASHALVEKNLALGDSFLKEENFELAREHFKLANDFAYSSQDRDEAQIRLGHLDQKEAPHETLEELAAKLRKTPDSPELIDEYATTLALEGYLPEAIRQFEKLSALTPENGEAHYRLGNAYFDARRYDDARRAYERAFDLGFEDKAELFYREGALVFHEKGDHPSAKKQYRKALEANPDHIDAIKGLAHLNVLEENSREAIELLDRAKQLDPEDEEARENIVDLYRQMNRYDEALLECARAVEQVPDPEAKERFRALRDEVELEREERQSDRAD